MKFLIYLRGEKDDGYQYVIQNSQQVLEQENNTCHGLVKKILNDEKLT